MIAKEKVSKFFCPDTLDIFKYNMRITADLLMFDDEKTIDIVAVLDETPLLKKPGLMQVPTDQVDAP